MLPSDRGGSETYKNHPVASLPDAPSFAGLRPGAAYTLAESVTDNISVCYTGHHNGDGSNSNFRQYCDYNRSAGKTCSSIVAGHPAPPPDLNHRLPVAPKLCALEPIGVEMSDLEGVVDLLFNIHSAGPVSGCLPLL